MRSARSEDRLSAKKIGLLHVARKQLGLSEDEYRAILMGRGGCESSADLDEDGFQSVIEHMNALGFRSEWTSRNFGRRRGMASPAQVELMRKLWADYHGPDDREAALNAWLAKYHKVSALRFVTAEKAKAVLGALRAMVARSQNRI